MDAQRGAPVLATEEQNGALLRLTLARPSGNILDRAMIRALRDQLEAARVRPELRAILLHGDGKHFSFGASVEEHLPDAVGAMLPEFHALFGDLLDCGKVLLAAVHGMCLGGALELVSACHRVFATPGAGLGQPEVKLGVIAPVASLLLPWRIGQRHADDLLLSGRTVTGEEALGIGLVDEVADDPVVAALAYFEEHLAPRSGVALAHAICAARWGLRGALEQLPALERFYLTDLMSTDDATEGLRSFLEKREPVWSHR